jgi:hypothetical protein
VSAPASVVNSAVSLGFNGNVAPSQTKNVQVSGADVPATATAVFANVVAVTPAADGNLVFHDRGTSVPNYSAMNFSGGPSDATGLTIQLDEDGGFAVSNTSTNSSATTGLRVDVQGYFVPTTSGEGSFVTLTPAYLFGTAAAGASIAGTESADIGSPLCQERGFGTAECAAVLVAVKVVRPVGRSILTALARRRVGFGAGTAGGVRGRRRAGSVGAAGPGCG